MSLLEIREARKSFGALCVTDNVTLEVREREIHALIGPNGAGKSCLIGQITGELPLDAGEIRFDGDRVDRLPVHARAQLGLKRAYQVPQFFSSFSAGGNVALAQIARERTGWTVWRKAGTERTLPFLRQVGLEAVGERPSASLGHGEKRQLELAMAFAGEPKLLLLDEPLAGLGPGDSERMVELLRSMKGRYAMLLVEHDMGAVFTLADRISVLLAGRIIASGTAVEIRANPEVRAAYLGDGTDA
ncbi:MAG TPA: ABC transporter ATP-binding protein [Burkholderiales bacterium]|nr:ABC transporter ATP-binding protein [Burkholderiales bacterium]